MLEIDVEQFEAIRGQLLDLRMNKDVSMFESQLKRSYNVKKMNGTKIFEQ